MRRYHILDGDKTTVDGTVSTNFTNNTVNGRGFAREGDDVYCPECDSVGKIILDGPHLYDDIWGRQAAVENDLCGCKCDPRPRLISSQTIRCQVTEDSSAPRARAAAQPATTTPPAANPASPAPRPSAFASAPSPGPGLVCENLWRSYQQQAEAIVAPGGVLIADPKARNRAINAAYARLWLEDNRFQWAGLAAFASKQVGCGLLHAADSIENIQAEKEAGRRLMKAANRRFNMFGLDVHERQARLREYKKAQIDYQETRRNNPVPSLDYQADADPLSYVQQQYLHVHEMLAMGNTTLFLDVYPLHAFYKERGLQMLRTCLPSRKKIYGNPQYPVLWPIEQETLEFGTNHNEILKAFDAIEVGNITKSVIHLAWHEQQNILQPSMYSNWRFVGLLRANQFSFVTGLPSGVAAAVELTLASKCRSTEDGLTAGFSDELFANLASLNQRMEFVLKAAALFDELLLSPDRQMIKQSILDIAAGRGVH